MNTKWIRLLFFCLLLFDINVYADPRIAILDFELDDQTLLPKTKSELKQAESFKPMLEQYLKVLGGYEIITINEQEKNAGLAYLFQHNGSSAELGKQSGADWIVVGRHRKLSFMYSRLVVHVINVKTGKLNGNFMIVLKGSNKKVTKKAIGSMAKKINKLIK